MSTYHTRAGLRRRRAAAARNRAFAAACEPLEVRRLMAVLSVNATTGNDIITLFVQNGTVSVRVNGGLPLTMSDISCTGVTLGALAGDDQILIHSNTDNPVTVTGSSGNDVLGLAVGDLSLISAPVTFDGGTHTSTTGDKVIVDDSDGTSTSDLTIGTTGLSRGRSGLALFTNVESFTLSANDLDNTIEVTRASAGDNLILANGGNDTIQVGDTSNRYQLIDNLSIEGGAGTDNLRIDDQGQALASGFTVTADTIDGVNGGVTEYDSTIESLTINGGDGGNFHRIDTTSFNTPVVLNCGIDDDVVQVAFPGQNLSAINSSLTISGQGGIDTVELFDQGNPAGEVYTVTNTGVASSQMPAITLANVSTTLHAGAGADTFDVVSSDEFAPITLNGGDGDDTFNLNSDDSTGMDLLGEVASNGDGGIDVVNLFDRSHSELTVYMAYSNFLRTQTGPVLGPFLEYSSVDSLLIETAGTIDDWFFIYSLDPGVNLVCDAEAGTGDLLSLSPFSHDVDAIQGPVQFIHTGPGGHTTLSDDDNTDPQVYSVSGQTVTRTGSGSFGGLNGFGGDLNIYAGSASDAFQINAVADGATVYCHGGAGDDQANFGNGQLASAIAGDVTFVGGIGTDDLLMDASADTLPHGYSYSHGTVFTSFADGLRGYDFESFKLKTGSGADGVSITSGEDRTIEIDTGAGGDNINILQNISTFPVLVNAGTGTNALWVDADGDFTGHVRLESAQHFSLLDIAFGGSVEVAAGGDNFLIADTLSITAGGKLDLADNDFMQQSLSRAAVETLVAQGRSGGTWFGGGITSSSAQAAPGQNTTLGVLSGSDYMSVYGGDATFHGEDVGVPHVLVKYTYYGDADFSGAVDFDDYVRFDAGYNSGSTGWLNGDFDLSGGVDFDDAVLIDLAFNTQGAPL